MKLPKKVKHKIRSLILAHKRNHEIIKTIIIKPMVSFITARKEEKYSLTVCLEHYEAWYLIGPKGGLRLMDSTK